MDFDQMLTSIDVANTTPADIKRAISDTVKGVEQRVNEICAEAVRADEIAKSALDLAQQFANDLERRIGELGEQIAVARAERGEALASGAPCAELDKSLRRLSEQRERAEDELAARKARIVPLHRDALVAHAGALADRREAIAQAAREARVLAEACQRRADVAIAFSQAMSRAQDLYSAGWQRAHSAVAEHDKKASAA